MGIPQPIALIVLSAMGKAKSKEEITKSLSVSLAEVNDIVEDYENLKKAVIMKNREIGTVPAIVKNEDGCQ